jgi:glycosyltransferase involved in cell wall biosynthesis
LLNEGEVKEKINQSNCGLILSASEGACFASSEYLLCGIPIVSTVSEGGRSVWYDEYNSLIVDANADAVTEGVRFFSSHRRLPQVIRDSHIGLAGSHRASFIRLLTATIESCGDYLEDPVRYFHNTFMHKLRTYIRPKFDELFPPL